MQLLEDVYSGYPATVMSGERASPRRATADIAAVWTGLPNQFRSMLSSAGYNPAEYRIYGGIGQVPFNWAAIPWVAICNRSVSTSTMRGYYIVLLFSQDMSGCYLSLNQGFTQYKEAYGPQDLAAKQAARCAAACAEYLRAEIPFISGPIDLAATNDMGKGYERGAIVSRHFSRDPKTAFADFETTFVSLLSMYSRLADRVGGDILSFMPPVSEQTYQSEAGAAATIEDLPALGDGPVAAPAALLGTMSGRYKRDPKMAARALRAANFTCEIEPAHVTFVARRNHHTFVEAHHLFPMSIQPQFQYSLDVPENIVALCPTCHRFLHHGTTDLVRPVLKKLFLARETQLISRGIVTTPRDLIAAYKRTLDEDD